MLGFIKLTVRGIDDFGCVVIVAVGHILTGRDEKYRITEDGSLDGIRFSSPFWKVEHENWAGIH
jgi:hypothetical protein